MIKLFALCFLTFGYVLGAADSENEVVPPKLSYYSASDYVPYNVLVAEGLDPFKCDYPKIYLGSDVVISPQILHDGLVCSGSTLRSLSVGVSGSGDAVVQVIASSLGGSPLTSLTMWRCGLTDQGALVIAQGLPGSNLVHLDLHRNLITDQGLLLIAQGIMGSKLESFDISRNAISPAAAQIFKALLESKTLNCVTY